VFGQQQCYAVFNQLNYHPRPVFQSYMAYNERLMRLNEQFYLSDRAPEYVLFELNPIDRRFPPLEDARAFSSLLRNYALVATEQPFLLLKHQSGVPRKVMLLKEGTAHAGDRIDLAGYRPEDIWLEIFVHPNWRGHLRKLFYKPSTVRISFWSERPGERLARARSPAPMLAAGFLASPLLLRNQDVIDFYEGKNFIRPAACSIETEFGERFWHETYYFRIYEIDLKGHPALEASNQSPR